PRRQRLYCMLFLLFVLVLTSRPSSTLFPYTTLFRSWFRRGYVPGSAQRTGAGSSSRTALPPSPGRCSRTSSATDARAASPSADRSEEHTSELQSRENIVCRLLLENKIRIHL